MKIVKKVGFSPEKPKWGDFGRKVYSLKKQRSDQDSSTDKLQEFIKIAPAFIYEIDFRGPKFITVNDKMCSYLGYTRDELLAMNPFDLMDEDGKKLFRSRIEHWLTGKKPKENVEYRIKTKNGKELFIVLDVTFTIIDGKPMGALVFGHDITDRKIAEEKLKYQARLLDSLHDSVIAYDTDLKITSMNKAAERIYGWKETDALGKNIASITRTENTDGQIANILDKLNKAGIWSGQAKHHNKRGQLLWIAANVIALRDDNREIVGYVGVHRDITKQKQIENALKASEERYRRIVETAEEGIVLTNTSGVFTFVNQKMADMLGYSRKEMIGKSALEFMDLKQQKEIIFNSIGHLMQGKKIQQEYKFKKKDGSVLWTISSATALFNESGNYIANIAMHMDITERKKAEESVKNIAKFPEQNPFPVIRISDKGILLYTNPASLPILKFWNCSLNSVVPKDIHMIVKQCLDTGEKQEIEIRTKDIIYSFIFLPISEANYVNVYGVDITKRVRLEKLKDEFVGIASHELKTPLTSLKMYTQIAIKRMKGIKDQQTLEMLEKIDYQANKINSLIGDLLDISKIQSGKLLLNKENFNILDLVREAVHDVRDISGTDIEIFIRSKVKGSIRADRYRIYQVLHNLLINAIKYSPDKKNIIINISREKDSIVVSVRDSGMGISKEGQKHLFEQFFQENPGRNNRTSPSLGLGLYISSEIIKRHAGKIWCKSKLGKGSTFFFTLPAG